MKCENFRLKIFLAIGKYVDAREMSKFDVFHRRATAGRNMCELIRKMKFIDRMHRITATYNGSSRGRGQSQGDFIRAF